MATRTVTRTIQGDQPSPSRRLVAAGIKRGPAAWLVEQPMTQTDIDCHAKAPHVRTAAR